MCLIFTFLENIANFWEIFFFDKDEKKRLLAVEGMLKSIKAGHYIMLMDVNSQTRTEMIAVWEKSIDYDFIRF